MSNTIPYTLSSIMILASMLLVGCDASDANTASQTQPRENMTYEERAQEVSEHFEKVRQNNRDYLKKAALNHPNEIRIALFSLTDYHPLETLEEFQAKYPELKIQQFMFSVLGAKHLVKINSNLPLNQEIGRTIQESRERIEGNIARANENPDKKTGAERAISEQHYLDALNTGNVRTYGFAVEGKIGDIEKMAEKEYGGDYLRVIHLSIDSDAIPTMYYDPVYAHGIKSEEAFK